ncbi:DNA-directed DNA polymerase II small subunit [Candidatus Woesearchaeota archaeon]|nr:DNA-directed DNA polymerase II small subunit [Candidatus Woesearchaeota archaeon]
MDQTTVANLTEKTQDIKREAVSYLLSKRVFVESADLELIDAYLASYLSTNPFPREEEEIGACVSGVYNHLLHQKQAQAGAAILTEPPLLSSSLPRPSSPNQKSLSQLSPPPSLPSTQQHVGAGVVNIIFTYDEEEKKRDVQDFVSFFNLRYAALRRILEHRQELQGAMSISRLQARKESGPVSIIGLIAEKNVTANNNIVLTLEDPTGQAKVLINKTKAEVYQAAKELVHDEVIGVTGTAKDSIIFANGLIHPDVPLNKELKKAPEESYALFLSDIHVGSKYFLPDEFEKFLSWIRGEAGTDEQRDVAAKVKYIFFVGDLVDGVGVYPAQEKELIIPDIYDQYKEYARLVSKIPPHIKLIMCAGNHDAIRMAEPQPRHDHDFSKPLYDLPNITIVSNPSLVNIDACDGFPGFDVLLYHGYSFDYYIANVDHIREQGGYDRADLVMKFLLQRRHLAPTHTSTLYVPYSAKDPLVIEKVPDIFASGHIHKAVAATYRNVTLISGSCWQSTTAFQEKMGHKPEPARVPAINLKTRQVKMLKF